MLVRSSRAQAIADHFYEMRVIRQIDVNGTSRDLSQ
jgi:hypothetical protein